MFVYGQKHWQPFLGTQHQMGETGSAIDLSWGTGNSNQLHIQFSASNQLHKKCSCFQCHVPVCFSITFKGEYSHLLPKSSVQTDAPHRKSENPSLEIMHTCRKQETQNNGASPVPPTNHYGWNDSYTISTGREVCGTSLTQHTLFMLIFTYNIMNNKYNDWPQAAA